jgi:YtkA-like
LFVNQISIQLNQIIVNHLNKISIWISILVLAIAFTSCKKDTVETVDPTVGLTKIAEGYAVGAGAKVKLYAASGSIKTGYTKFYIMLSDSTSGTTIQDAHIHLTPMMDMGMMQHSAPVENPESEEAVNQLYPCSVTFIMPSMGGSWTLEVEVHNHLTDKEGSVTFPITVTDPVKATVKSFTGLHDNQKYFVALINPAKPIVGINDLEFAIYKKASMMSFPADSSLLLSFTPEMPTMGHGSPNNVQPIHVGNGHYKGKVNFTMTGLWRLNNELTSNGAIADSTQFFEIEF